MSDAAEITSTEVGRLLLDCGAVRFGEFTLASGARSDVYVDVKRAWTEPNRLDRLSRALAARLPRNIDRLAGIELGAVPLLVALALRTGRPFVVVRKAAKEHGTRQRYEGELTPGEEVLVVEDVVTTGGSVLATIDLLRGAGARVGRVLCVVDRGEGGRERLAQAGVELDRLVTLNELRGARA